MDTHTLEIIEGLADLDEVSRREEVDVVAGSEISRSPGNLAVDAGGEALRQRAGGDSVVLVDLSHEGRSGGLDVHGRHCGCVKGVVEGFSWAGPGREVLKEV